jgi:hypothetical protein
LVDEDLTKKSIVPKMEKKNKRKND